MTIFFSSLVINYTVSLSHTHTLINSCFYSLQFRKSLKPNSCSREVAAEHAGEHKHNPAAAAAAGRRPPLSPPEAEIEAFFAAAELAERRRFAEKYVYTHT